MTQDFKGGDEVLVRAELVCMDTKGDCLVSLRVDDSGTPFDVWVGGRFVTPADPKDRLTQLYAERTKVEAEIKALEGQHTKVETADGHWVSTPCVDAESAG